MKTKLAPCLAALLVLPMFLVVCPNARAQVNATAWTSVDGTTIWARLDGWDGSRVILNLRGKEFRVPMTRLAPKSVEKARTMLNLPKAKVKTEMAAVSPKPKAASLKTPEPVPSVPWVDLELVATKEAELTVSPPPTEAVFASTNGPENPDAALPEFSESVEPAEAGYGSLLPARDNGLASARTSGSRAELVGRLAIAPAGLPSVILTAIEAGNRLQNKTYKWGGGRANLEDTGYDCSGSVSYVLIKAGLLSSPITSGSFTRYGAPGPGRWITVHARNGHVFMTLCGLRLDTSGHRERGPRWSTNSRGSSGFVMRHPIGF